jgi:glyoxylase-like metal-dependent hydrolase (beta-lactamase superfamily II)
MTAPVPVPASMATTTSAACIESFFDAATSTVTHLVSDPQTGRAAIIDSVLDYDSKSGRTRTASAERLVQAVRGGGYTVDWHLETHAHADHLSAAPYLQQQLGGRIAIGQHICQVQAAFKPIFNASDLHADGRAFDHLLQEGEEIAVGALRLRVLHTPGHTPACVAYAVGDDVFVGDTLFMPDYGTARCDFPGGDARTLYRSIQRLLALPAYTRLHLCHDYAPGGRAPLWVSTVAQQLTNNVHAHQGVSEDEFVAMRQARDKTLDMPTLILPAVQVNLRAGRLPPAEDNGVHYLKIPLNAL